MIMRKFTLLLFVLIAVSSVSVAQFRLQTNATIGQILTIDSIGGKPTGVSNFRAHFNSLTGNSFYNETTITFRKCQTQRGMQVKTYADATTTAATTAGDFKCDNYGSNGNPVRIASTDSLIAIMKKHAALNLTTADSVRNLYWKPAACLFDVVKGDSTNLAFGCYPGKFKRVEYGFQFDFNGLNLSSDITFSIDTYDPGNTGKTATYKLIVFLGSVSAANAVDTIENFYVTGSGKKEVKLAEALGVQYSTFSSKKVYIMITTLGTDSEIVEGKYDPIIIFDEFKATWGSPEWVSPIVISGQKYNESGTGIYTDYTLDGNVGTAKLFLKDKGRIANLTLINDVQTPPSIYQFKETNGVYANDGNGNYNVPVAYTFSPSVLNETTGNMSKSYITIPAPTASTNDDIMVLMTFTPNQTTETVERIEINNGVRFWWDVQTKALSGMDVKKVHLNDLNIHTTKGMVYVNGSNGNVVIYNYIGQKLGTYESSVAAAGISVNQGLIIISTPQGATKIIVQ